MHTHSRCIVQSVCLKRARDAALSLIHRACMSLVPSSLVTLASHSPFSPPTGTARMSSDIKASMRHQM